MENDGFLISMASKGVFVLCASIFLSSVQCQLIRSGAKVSINQLNSSPYYRLPINNWNGDIMRTLSLEDLRSITQSTVQTISQIQKQDRSLYSAGVDNVLRHSTNDQHRNIQKPKKEAMKMRWAGEACCFSSLKIKQLLGLTADELYRYSKVQPTEDQMRQRESLLTPETSCSYKPIKCGMRARFSKYRTADGRCNNLRHGLWGRAFTPFTRNVVAAYSDGADAPRLYGSDSKPLPSARLVSRTVHENSHQSQLDHIITHFVMQFGQFLDHDHSHAPIIQGTDANGENTGINCCMEDVLKQGGNVGNVTQRTLQERNACFPIHIPKGDKSFKKSCMNFIRSVPTPHLNCQFGQREQLNQLTAYIDGSQIYGSSDKEQRELRTMKGGLLKERQVPGFSRHFLPVQDAHDGGCIIPTNRPDVHCPRAGDERVNEHSALTSMHTIWMREHNRIARILGQRHFLWGDDKIFKEAQRIVAAEIQHITYDQFLPILLGPRVMKRWRLNTMRTGYFTGYNPNVNPQMAASFSTAAYRFGHSLIRTMFIRKHTAQPDTSVQLSKMFNRPEHIFDKDGPSSFIAGLTAKAQHCDRFVSKEVTELLFDDGKGNALDLVSLNIQRGRDHGIPGYTRFRRFCNLRVARDFSYMPDMPQSAIIQLRKVYRHVDDIDLFTGGLSELPVPGGIVGPTFACLIAEQHRRTKIGDRFYYENPNQGYLHWTRGFTRNQLNNIRSVTLAGIVCENTDVPSIQENVFIQSSRIGNPVKPCHVIRKLNPYLF